MFPGNAHVIEPARAISLAPLFEQEDDMPSKSPAQARLMAAVAHGWKKPGGGGPPAKVAREFNKADAAKRKGKK